jgi:beta-lactamase regulating signal transducer with metallopeptidase domain
MTPSYLTRLVLLSSALFFLAQIVFAAVVSLLTPMALQRAQSMRPRAAARWLLTLRLLPVALSALVVAGLCVPSYLRFEPRIAEEEVGFVCLAAAISGALLGVVALYRSLAALIRSASYVRQSRAVESRIEGEMVWVGQQNAGLALAGILRPRLLVSEQALRDLSAEQLAVALRHELAHRESRDNLKRLLILLAPSIFPRLRLLEKTWTRYAEWSADDRASAGDENRAATLAEALVRVARLQTGIAMPALVTSLVEADEDLSLRVDRLLAPTPLSAPGFRAGWLALPVFLIAALAATPSALRLFHEVLEVLMD